MTKGLKILLPILILSVLALVGTYYLSQKDRSGDIAEPPAVTNEETPTNGEVSECKTTGTKEGWLLYENKELGFSFEYPEEWGKVDASIKPAASFGKGKFFFGGFTKYHKLAFGGAASKSYESRSITYTDFGFLTIDGSKYFFNVWTSKGLRRDEIFIEKQIASKSGDLVLVVDVKKSNGDSLTPRFSTRWAALVNLDPFAEFKGLAFGGSFRGKSDTQEVEDLLKTFCTTRVSGCEKFGSVEGRCLYESKDLKVSFEYPKSWYLYDLYSTGYHVGGIVLFRKPPAIKFRKGCRYCLERAYSLDHISLSKFKLYIQRAEAEDLVRVSPEEFIRWQVGENGEGRTLGKVELGGRTWYRWITPTALHFDDRLLVTYYFPYWGDKLLRVSLFPVPEVAENSPDYEVFTSLLESVVLQNE